MLSGDYHESRQLYKRYGRPYLCAAGIQNRIRFIFTMSPLMSKVATGAEFMQCDVTYDECKEYPYLFNAVVFNLTTME